MHRAVMTGWIVLFAEQRFWSPQIKEASRKENTMKRTSGKYLAGLYPLALAFWLVAGARAQSQPIPQPPAEIQSLEKALVGRWSTTYDFVPGIMSPNVKGTGSGEELWRTSPGGFVLMEEEQIHTPFGEMFVFAIHWWDKRTNSLRGMLCNNSGPGACNVDTYSNSTLKWDGKQFTIDMQFPEHGKKMLWHEVWSDITATSFTQTGDVGEVGGALKRAVTIHGTKLAERASGTAK
jgi:hypothetical protein